MVSRGEGGAFLATPGKRAPTPLSIFVKMLLRTVEPVGTEVTKNSPHRCRGRSASEFTQAEILPWPLSPGGQHRPQWPSQACALSPVPSAGGSSGRRQRMVFGVIACAELDPAAVQDTAIRCLPVPRLWLLLSAVPDLSSGSCADLVTAVCAIQSSGKPPLRE